MEHACPVVTFSIADRQSALEAELRTVQASRRDVENFSKWIQEAEATVNVLADASQRENALQDSALARELKQQMQVSGREAKPRISLCCALLSGSGQAYRFLLPYSVRKSILLYE